MRLYNSSSCTPVGSTHYARKKNNTWSPPKPYVPQRAVSMGLPLPEQRSCTAKTRTTYAPGTHLNDVRDTTVSPCFVAELEGTSTLRTSIVGGPALSRTHRNHDSQVKTPQEAAAGHMEWDSIDSSRKSPVNQPSREETTESPFVVLPKNPWSSAQRTISFAPSGSRLQPTPELQVVATSKSEEECGTPPNSWDDFVPSLAAMSLITEHGEGDGDDDDDDGFVTSTPKLSPTESSSVASSTWRDFSLDGSENPFQQASSTSTASKSNRKGTNKTLFSPIEKPAPTQQQAIMTVKPTPVHRTTLPTTSYCLFPSQHSRERATSFSNVAKENSAFVPPNSTRAISPPFWNPTMHPKNGHCTPGRLVSRPTTTPSSSIVETIIFSRCARCGDKNSIQLEQAVSLQSLMDLTKYCRMLKAGVPFEHVLGQMELDDADGAIIELAIAASNHGGNR